MTKILKSCECNKTLFEMSMILLHEVIEVDSQCNVSYANKKSLCFNFMHIQNIAPKPFLKLSKIW
ncbi:hypothetical protein C797_18487 [Bacillus thuringiensis Sbt003]|uniref:Uncharacterized protein n=1 Tax=Bacillus thuringiensis Sbt003 TaxID=1235825 RepID=A0A9X0JY19_BACTU|nr:hypothetical protein C797_18487 [Bacillus thuringiensis Sbt003]